MASRTSSSRTDPTLAQLRGLTAQTRALAVELINELRDAGWPAVIVALGARRTQAEQRQLVRTGLSNDLHSPHLRGRAFDLDLYRQKRGDVPQVFWEAAGELGEQLGLRWGGRWRKPDVAHFEVPRAGG